MDQFIDNTEREIEERQQLVTPRMFGRQNVTHSDSEDSEDHLEEEATQEDLNNTGELDTTIEQENPEEETQVLQISAHQQAN